MLSNFFQIFLLISPVFLLIILGNFLRRIKVPDISFWEINDKLCYWVLIPALLFHYISQINLSSEMLYSYSIIIYVGFFIAILNVLILGKLLGYPPERWTSILQGAVRQNAFIALAITGSLFGDEGLKIASIFMLIYVPSINIIIVTTMVMNFGQSKKNVSNNEFITVFVELSKNPFILAMITGLIFSIIQSEKFARIIGTGSYLPPKIVTNFDLEKTLDTSDEWITARTGIKERRIVTDQNTCDLAFEASIKALAMAELKPDDIDLIILSTTTPDKIFPATATILQNRLGAICPAFDLQAVCAGFVFALTTAQQYIENGAAKNILVVGSETMSRIVDWNDRSTAILFADGAGAVILSADNNTGIKHSKLYSDGNYLSSLHVNNNRINELGTIEMEGNEVFKIAVNKLSEVAEETLTDCNMTSEDIHWMVPHQANIRIINAIAKRIKLPLDKVILTLDKHGNTSAASIPLALDTGVRDGRIKKGDTLLFEGIGGGFSWGSILLEY